MDSDSGSFSDDDLTFYSGMSTSPPSRVPKLSQSATSATSGLSRSSKSSSNQQPETSVVQRRNQPNHQNHLQNSHQPITKQHETSKSMHVQSSAVQQPHRQGEGKWIESLQKKREEINKKISDAQLNVQNSFKSNDEVATTSSRKLISEATDEKTQTRIAQTGKNAEIKTVRNKKYKTPAPSLKFGTRRRSRSWSPVRSLSGQNSVRACSSSVSNTKQHVIRAPATTRASALKSEISGVSSFNNWDTISVASSFFQVATKRKPKLHVPVPEPELVQTTTTTSASDSSISTKLGDPNISLSLSQSISLEGEDIASVDDESPRNSPIHTKARTPRSLFFGLIGGPKQNDVGKLDELKTSVDRGEEEPNEVENISQQEDEELEMMLTASLGSENNAEEEKEEQEEEEQEGDGEPNVNDIEDEISATSQRKPVGQPKTPSRKSFFFTTKKRLGQNKNDVSLDTTGSAPHLNTHQSNDTEKDMAINPSLSCRSQPIMTPRTPKTPKTPTRLSQIFGRKTPTSRQTNAEEGTVASSQATTPKMKQMFVRKAPRGVEDNIGASQPTPRERQLLGRSSKVQKETAEELETSNQSDERFSTKAPQKKKGGQQSVASSRQQNPAETDSRTRRSTFAPSSIKENKSRASGASARSFRRQLAKKSQTHTITMDTAKELLSGDTTIRIFDPSPRNAPGNNNVWYSRRSYLQSKERESQEPRQNLVSINKTALLKWVVFAKEGIHEANTKKANMECDSTIASLDSMKTEETEKDESILFDTTELQEAAGNNSDIQQLENEAATAVTKAIEEDIDVVTLQESKTDLGVESDDADDLRSVSSFEVLFNCVTCSILPYDPYFHLNNDDDYFGGQIQASFVKINEQWKRVNSLHT